MTKDEALKLALEALEGLNNTNSYWWQEVDEQTLKKIEPAITAIKEALAQPEQEPVVTDAMVEAAVKAFWGYANSKVCRTAYRLAIKAALQEKFCDNNCVWTDHHPDCKLGQPDRQELPSDKIAKHFGVEE